MRLLLSTTPSGISILNGHDLSAGKPRGSQAVYNTAMWQLFHKDDSTLDSTAKVITIAEPRTEQEKVAVKLRNLLDLQAISRQRLAVQVGSVSLLPNHSFSSLATSSARLNERYHEISVACTVGLVLWKIDKNVARHASSACITNYR